MNVMTILGAILIVIGAIGLIYGGLTYTSTRDVVDMGPMTVEVDQQRQVPFSPIAGGIALAAGLVLVILGTRRPARARIG